jgi:hypothetical protein
MLPREGDAEPLEVGIPKVLHWVTPILDVVTWIRADADKKEGGDYPKKGNYRA